MALFIQPPPNTSADTLRQMSLDYNWSDGFAFPQAIADHPNCDLAVALELFWLTDAISVYLGEASVQELNVAWRSFCKLLTQRLLGGYYIHGPASFRVPLTKTQIYKYQKLGVPSIFLTGVEQA